MHICFNICHIYVYSIYIADPHMQQQINELGFILHCLVSAFIIDLVLINQWLGTILYRGKRIYTTFIVTSINGVHVCVCVANTLAFFFLTRAVVIGQFNLMSSYWIICQRQHVLTGWSGPYETSYEDMKYYFQTHQHALHGRWLTYSWHPA